MQSTLKLGKQVLPRGKIDRPPGYIATREDVLNLHQSYQDNIKALWKLGIELNLPVFSDLERIKGGIVDLPLVRPIYEVMSIMEGIKHHHRDFYNHYKAKRDSGEISLSSFKNHVNFLHVILHGLDDGEDENLRTAWLDYASIALDLKAQEKTEYNTQLLKKEQREGWISLASLFMARLWCHVVNKICSEQLREGDIQLIYEFLNDAMKFNNWTIEEWKKWRHDEELKIKMHMMTLLLFFLTSQPPLRTLGLLDLIIAYHGNQPIMNRTHTENYYWLETDDKHWIILNKDKKSHPFHVKGTPPSKIPVTYHILRKYVLSSIKTYRQGDDRGFRKYLFVNHLDLVKSIDKTKQKHILASRAIEYLRSAIGFLHTGNPYAEPKHARSVDAPFPIKENQPQGGEGMRLYFHKMSEENPKPLTITLRLCRVIYVTHYHRELAKQADEKIRGRTIFHDALARRMRHSHDTAKTAYSRLGETYYNSGFSLFKFILLKDREKIDKFIEKNWWADYDFPSQSGNRVRKEMATFHIHPRINLQLRLFWNRDLLDKNDTLQEEHIRNYLAGTFKPLGQPNPPSNKEGEGEQQQQQGEQINTALLQAVSKLSKRQRTTKKALEEGLRRIEEKQQKPKRPTPNKRLLERIETLKALKEAVERGMITAKEATHKKDEDEDEDDSKEKMKKYGQPNEEDWEDYPENVTLEGSSEVIKFEGKKYLSFKSSAEGHNCLICSLLMLLYKDKHPTQIVTLAKQIREIGFKAKWWGSNDFLDDMFSVSILYNLGIFERFMVQFLNIVDGMLVSSGFKFNGVIIEGEPPRHFRIIHRLDHYQPLFPEDNIDPYDPIREVSQVLWKDKKSMVEFELNEIKVLKTPIYTQLGLEKATKTTEVIEVEIEDDDKDDVMVLEVPEDDSKLEVPKKVPKKDVTRIGVKDLDDEGVEEDSPLLENEQVKLLSEAIKEWLEEQNNEEKLNVGIKGLLRLSNHSQTNERRQLQNEANRLADLMRLNDDSIPERAEDTEPINLQLARKWHVELKKHGTKGLNLDMMVYELFEKPFDVVSYGKAYYQKVGRKRYLERKRRWKNEDGKPTLEYVRLLRDKILFRLNNRNSKPHSKSVKQYMLYSDDAGKWHSKGVIFEGEEFLD